MSTGVLVVDDHPCSGVALSELLGSAGYAVTHATTYQAGVEVLDESPHTCIIDYHLAGSAETGIDLVRLARVRLPHATLFMISADPPEQYQDEAFAAGADYVMGKPLDYPLLLKRMPPPRGVREVS